MGQKEILEYIDEHFETIKEVGLVLLVQEWTALTPEDLKKKWKKGAKEHGQYVPGSLNLSEAISEEVTDALNYTMLLLLERGK